MFVHDKITPYELKEDYDSYGRHYTTPSGARYPSVTTVLGKAPKPSLDEWRERVGNAEADKIMKQSSKIGNIFHDACEDYINNKTVSGLSGIPKQLFSAVKKPLKDNITKVYSTEIPLWSDYLKVAGRSDLIADWNGVPSIVDYKNSRKPKIKEYCSDYFKQGACYSKMLLETHDLLCKQIVIVIGVWGQPQPTIFIEKVKDWYPKVLEHMKLYHPYT